MLRTLSLAAAVSGLALGAAWAQTANPAAPANPSAAPNSQNPAMSGPGTPSSGAMTSGGSAQNPGMGTSAPNSAANSGGMNNNAASQNSGGMNNNAASNANRSTTDTTGSTARTGTTANTTEVPGPWLGTQVWKQAVYDGQENRIGEVDNLVIAPDGKITDALIGVGGFLGLGEKTVAIPFSQLKAMKRNGNMWFMTSMSKEQLNNAPAYDTARFDANK